MASPKPWDWTNGHVQRETGTDSLHVEREVVFRYYPREYRLKFSFPKYIYDVLGEGDRERCRVFCEDLFQKMYLVAQLAHEPQAERICLEEALRTYIDNLYRGFVRIQIRKGNKKWLVPGTIQRDVLEEN